MGYSIIIRKQAKKKLEALCLADRVRITEKIMLLGTNPNNPELDIKKLEAEPYYRLRAGRWRVIFDKQDVLKIISIEKIKPRGDAYK